MKVEPLRAVRDRLSELVDHVHRQHERVTITRNGTPVAVLMSPGDLEMPEETLDVLGNEETVRGLRDAEVALGSGDLLRGKHEVRRLRDP